ncbi:anaerobic ribonucleoside-triphosphate reductase [Clostridium sp. HBUAS56010]|uniref:anaerobic ribonucleoside-triphosphate reductase n=1 Tax=Clostridium sp. HBUAS56010 TaxID=2571127 RepID=UPI00117799E7|nr:anaerobic ribonucleoside-triphosphate reductase [Clostridium sp. HBUAS56010]
MKIIKRDGSQVEFDKGKIKKAILKAFIDADGEESPYAKEKARDVASYIESLNKKMSVEDIQDIVEEKLMSSSRKDVARAYIQYRLKRSLIRESNTTDKSILELLEGNSEYWNTENSNKNARLNTTIRDYTAGVVSKDLTERILLPRDIVEAHNAGIIHFHDEDYYMQRMHNCDLVNLEDMLQNGTVISETLIEKPHSFSTACNIATQIIAQVASSQYGGQSISLAHLAPFVDISRKSIRNDVIKERTTTGDDLDEVKIEKTVRMRLAKEIKKGIQTIQYQIVTLMTTNGQAPFLTLFMYLGEAKNEQEKTDLALLIEEVLIQSHQGVKNEEGSWITPAFPKVIYVLEEDNIHESSKYWYLTELAAKCSVKRLTPDYISEKIMKEMKDGNCYPVMGCRSALTVWKDENGNPKFYGRFNQGVVTLNLVDLALSSKGDMVKFWNLFEERTELCHRALQCRHERLEGTPSDVAPILWQHGALARLEKGEAIDKLLHGGYSTLSLGYAGLYECVKYMTGHSHSDEDIGESFGLAVMKAMNDKCSEWKVAENIDYSLYGTPLESTTYKFSKCLQERFGLVKGITDRSYITNSYHIPVFEEIDAFEKLQKEAKFQRWSPGGAISYIEAPNLDNNIPAVLEVIKFIYENNIYAEINTKSDHCQICGYDKEIKLIDEDGKLIWECPNCGNRDVRTMDITRRTCGYKGTARNGWNQGRLGDIHDRVMHLDDIEFEGSDS